MIAVLIPAHNEAARIGACLASVLAAAASADLRGEEVRVVVALDRCTDGTAAIVARAGVTAVALDAGNVGRARAAAAAVAIRAGARWLATTDADSLVPGDWLAAQLAHGCDAFCGIVTVRDWEDYGPAVREAFAAGECRHDGHPHVHGANLGLSAQMYARCGGFRPLPAHEDVALVDALVAAGARIARMATPAVVTSARRAGRAQGGFADYLLAMERRVEAGTGARPGTALAVAGAG